MFEWIVNNSVNFTQNAWTSITEDIAEHPIHYTITLVALGALGAGACWLSIPLLMISCMPSLRNSLSHTDHQLSDDTILRNLAEARQLEAILHQLENTQQEIGRLLGDETPPSYDYGNFPNEAPPAYENPPPYTQSS